MPKTKKSRAINDLQKHCNVLLLKLSKSKISSLQENPIQGSKSLDLPIRRYVKECYVSLNRLTNYEIRNAMKGTRIIPIPYLPKKGPCMSMNELMDHIINEFSQLKLQAERETKPISPCMSMKELMHHIINELSQLKLQAERETKSKASKLQIHLGSDYYRELFQVYFDKCKVFGIDMKEILLERNINEELFLPNRISGPEFIELNMDLVACIMEISKISGFKEYQRDNEMDKIYEGARIFYRDNRDKILARRPREKSCSVCTVCLLRLSKSGTKNAMERGKITAFYLPGKRVPPVLASVPEPPVLASVPEPPALASVPKPPVFFSFNVYLKVFKEYLTLLHSGNTEIKEKLSDRNITRQLRIKNRVSGTYFPNRALVTYLMESNHKGFGVIQLTRQRQTIMKAARVANAQILEAQRRRDMAIATRGDEPIAPRVVDEPIAPAEQRSSKLEYISGDEYEMEEMTIERADYLFPIDAPEIPKAAIILMSDCPGYLSNLKETNVNGNKMWQEPAHVKEQTEIDASQNKMRKKPQGPKRIQKRKNDQGRKAEIFLGMMHRINSPRRFLNNLWS